jgi:hypothetical protein
MSMVVAVGMSMGTRMVMGVSVPWGVRMGVHLYQVYSTSLAVRAHPEVSSCYWNFDNKVSEFVDAPSRDCHYHTRAQKGRMGRVSSAHVRGIQAPRRDR